MKKINIFKSLERINLFYLLQNFLALIKAFTALVVIAWK